MSRFGIYEDGDYVGHIEAPSADEALSRWLSDKPHDEPALGSCVAYIDGADFIYEAVHERS